ncbi:glycerol transporter [Malassezia brasiliensis]|uniref:Glycerol transporter n=1 Tax=Malassezia brasiliensis TaxID=1821822 RepID=A0AAF0IP85_9BASI|nr:glycerol transporter [Malassezia brasiliensis]
MEEDSVRARLMPLETEREGDARSRWQRRGITLLTVDPYITEGPEAPAKNEPVPPPRWWTREFLVYFVVLFTIGPYMVWVPMRLSTPEGNPNFDAFAHRLVPGWMQGRMRDNSDYQYRLFRNYLPMIFLLMSVYVALAWSVKGAAHLLRCTLAQRLAVRQVLWGAMGVVCVGAMHGSNAPKLLALALGNYALARQSTRLVPWAARAAVWVYNCAMLFLVFYTAGVPYARIAPSLAWLVRAQLTQDAYAGLLPRWYINYNFSMLRFVSYALDYQWAKAQAAQETPRELAPGVPDARTRMRQHRALQEYGMRAYLLYIFYPPLFIAGPIMTFNDFAAQLRRPLPVRVTRVVMYAVHCALLLLAMEFLLHYMYINAIKNAHAWANHTPMELSMIGFWNLMFVWLKLLLPWRVFRLWALLDGVDPPENMIRAMFNNYSAMGFWRSWHRSYNLWIVRYIYIPVGGSRNLLPAVLLVFTFVALWHDLSFTLLAWAWLITLFIAPEAAARYVLPSRTYGARPWYRHVCALGGALNVLMMTTANLVGFVVGVDGVKYLWSQLVRSRAGMLFLAEAIPTLFVGVQLMFEYRAEELRRNIQRKC